jgi:hypothetical protein
MALTLEQFGQAGKFLKIRGWAIVSTPLSRGSAQCDGPNRRILVKSSIFAKPSVRHRRYVIPHEIAHAVHWELDKYAVEDLITVRKLTKWSAVEVVAEAYCLSLEKTRWMTAWVRASVAWHSRVGYRYSWADVTSPEAKQKVAELKKLIQTPQSDWVISSQPINGQP